MANERLREALYESGLTVRQVAEDLAVDQKTVERWIAQSRLPYPRHRYRLAARLGQAESELWPDAPERPGRRPETSPDAGDPGGQHRNGAVLSQVQVYPHRSSVPLDLWRQLVERASHRIDVLVYAGWFLLDQDLQLAEPLRTKAAAGTRIRLLLGDPACEAVRERGQEEGVGDAMAAKVRQGVERGLPLTACPGISVRLHRTTLYASIYQFDDDLLVNAHVYGLAPAHAPVLHIRRSRAGDLFETYIRSFERVWQDAQVV